MWLTKTQEVVEVISKQRIALECIEKTPKPTVFKAIYYPSINMSNKALITAIFEQLCEDTNGGFFIHHIMPLDYGYEIFMSIDRSLL